MRLFRGSRPGPAGAAPATDPPDEPGRTPGSGPLPPPPVPLHPEADDADAQVMRWVVPTGVLSVRGRVTQAPGALGELRAAGVIADMHVAADAVTIRLAEGRTWRDHGSRVRTALGDALRMPRAWAAAGVAVDGPDAVLTEVTLAVLEGDAGAYVRSHGGHIDLVGVADGCVNVRLSGACGHCPAAAATLRHRVETAIRAVYPDLVSVRQVA